MSRRTIARGSASGKAGLGLEFQAKRPRATFLALPGEEDLVKDALRVARAS